MGSFKKRAVAAFEVYLLYLLISNDLENEDGPKWSRAVFSVADDDAQRDAQDPTGNSAIEIEPIDSYSKYFFEVANNHNVARSEDSSNNLMCVFQLIFRPLRCAWVEDACGSTMMSSPETDEVPTLTSLASLHGIGPRRGASSDWSLANHSQFYTSFRNFQSIELPFRTFSLLFK
jgi:hypothetical protein